MPSLRTHLATALRASPAMERLCPRAPPREKPWRERALVSGTLLLAYLTAAHLPLLGVADAAPDASTWKQMLGVKGGTWMALGVDPIVTAGLVFKLLVACGVLRGGGDDKVARRDDELLQTAVTLAVTAWQLLWYLHASVEWDHGLADLARVGLVALQLAPLGVLLVLLDNATGRGAGLLGASSLYVAASTVTSVLWRALSPWSAPGTDAPEGAVPALLQGAWHQGAPGLVAGALRPDGANVPQVLVTGLLVGAAVVLHDAQVHLLTKRAADPKNHARPYGIKLTHTAETPVVLYAMVTSHFNAVSQALWHRYGTGWLGAWETDRLRPVGGLAHWIDPRAWLAPVPADVAAARLAGYAAFTLAACVTLSVVWACLDGLSARGVAQQFAQQKLTVVGHREASTRRLLHRHVSAATVWSGLLIGGLVVLTEVCPPLVSGVSLFVAVSTLEGLAASVAGNEHEIW